MRSFFFAIVMLYCDHAQGAEEFLPVHLRLEIHGVGENVGDFDVSPTGWLIAPNLTQSGEVWVTLAGLKISRATWELELLAGAVMTDGLAVPIADTRFGYAPKLLSDRRLVTWTNFAWTFNDQGGAGYVYSRIDYLMKTRVIALGIETENTIHIGHDNVWSIGPRMVLPLGHLSLILAYQVHENDSNQLWIRTVLSP
jgi:hypothetical protein